MKIHMRDILSILVLTAGISAVAQPNILFIIADDLDPRLGCYGDAYAHTPNVDSLAANGIQFNRVYCQIPTCGPSRASMFSGCYPWDIGATDNKTATHFDYPVATLPAYLREQGYASVRCGKLFHLNIPLGIGQPSESDDPAAWDVVRDSTGWDNNRQALVDAGIETSSGVYEKAGVVPAWLADGRNEALFSDSAVTRDALELLKTHHPKRTGKPLFLAVGYYRPHPPMVAPSSYFAFHDLATAPLATLLENDRNDIPSCAFHRPTDPAYHYLPESMARSYIQARYAAVSYIDAQVGRVLDAWKTAGMGEDSIIIFTGDQGFHLGEHGYWHKSSLFDPGLKVPLIISGNKQTGVRNEISQLIDIYPTLLGMAGLQSPAHLQGRDLLKSTDNPKTRYALSQYSKGISIRTDRYRYNRWKTNDGIDEELYDYEKDPDEFHNLANDPEMKAIKMQLADQLNSTRGSH
jgi:iduronate 2-sulfatase